VHVVAVFGGNTITLYRNGQQYGSSYNGSAISSSAWNNNSRLVMGVRSTAYVNLSTASNFTGTLLEGIAGLHDDSHNNFFSGAIHSVTLIRGALLAEEVLGLYESHFGKPERACHCGHRVCPSGPSRFLPSVQVRAAQCIALRMVAVVRSMTTALTASAVMGLQAAVLPSIADVPNTPSCFTMHTAICLDVFHSFASARGIVSLKDPSHILVSTPSRTTMHWFISSALSWALAAGAGYVAYLVYVNGGEKPSTEADAPTDKPSHRTRSKKAKAKKGKHEEAPAQDLEAKPPHADKQPQKKLKAKAVKHINPEEDPNAPLPPKEEEPLPERVDVAPPTQELSDSEDDEEWAAVEKKQRERKVTEPEMYPDSPVAAAGAEDAAFYTVAARRHQRAKDAQTVADERKAAKNKRKREKQKQIKAQEDAAQKARLEAYRAQQRAAGVRYST
ncbi:hypothetical protein FOZ63_003088, partial [Perkinsus olseni]